MEWIYKRTLNGPWAVNGGNKRTKKATRAHMRTQRNRGWLLCSIVPLLRLLLQQR